MDAKKDSLLSQEVGVLRRREIEARILLPVVQAMEAELGAARANEVLLGVVDDAAVRAGRALREEAVARGTAEPDLVDFRAGWEPWFRDGALEIEELAQGPDEWSFNVTRCRYAEMYCGLGVRSLGDRLSCRRDAMLLTGFSEHYELERTQTIMEGASHCDFRYRLKPGRGRPDRSEQ